MPAPWIVAKACDAEQRLHDLRRLLSDLRVDTVAVVGDLDHPGAQAVIAELLRLSELTDALLDGCEPLVVSLAALIELNHPDRERRRHD